MTITFQNLKKTYGTVTALHVRGSHKFAENSIISVIGPNGAGKTTLLNVLSGFTRPDHGHVHLNGRALHRSRPHKVVAMGLTRTFQEVRLIGELTVKENLLLAFPGQTGASISGLVFQKKIADEHLVHSQRADELLRQVDLSEAADQMANACSYGQRKLASIACAVATGAEWLLLDEPVAGVASPIVDRIADLLRQLKNAGKNIMLIEHDLQFVRVISDRVVAMHNGEIILEGSADEVLESSDVVASYIG